MKNYGMPILLIPLPTRVKYEFLEYIREHKNDLTENQVAVLERYAATDEILDSIVEHFFAHWFDGDRKSTLEQWVRNSIQAILEVYA